MEKKFITVVTNIIEDQEYYVKGAVIKIISEGEHEKKRPIIISVQIEESCKIFKICSWDYGLLQTFKTAIANHNICIISFKANMYKDNMNFKLLSFEETGEKSTLKELTVTPKTNDINKAPILALIDQVNNENYKKILDDLIVNNNNFFIWRAAKANHHAFEGGLALHSLNVCNNAINIANTYSATIDINYDLLITGALLHDIGKIKEYQPSGEFSFEGQLLSHIVIGIENIDECCSKFGIDSHSPEILRLKHIIAAHHGKREFGSPNTPVIVEAYIVNEADLTDAKLEAINETMPFMNEGDISQPITCLDGGKIFKI